MDQDNQLESQVIFGHLENTLAVRCQVRNEMVAVSREIKLVANGKILYDIFIYILRFSKAEYFF